MRTWYPLSFESDGRLAYPDQVDGPDGIAAALLASPNGPVTDMWILSYGWNTSVEEGEDFYTAWVGLVRQALQQAQPEHCTPLFVGVFWPSKILADTSSRPTASLAPHPSSAALLGERADFLEAYRPIFDPEHRQDDTVYAHDFGGIYDFMTSPDITDESRVAIPGHDGLAGAYVNVVEQGLVDIPLAIIYSVRDLANRRLYPLGMAPIFQESLIVTEPLNDSTHYHVSNELRGAIGANGAQGFASSEMALLTLPWQGIDERTLSTARCINVNRTPFISLDDPLIGIHNDWKEPEIFRAAVGISLLKRANT